MAFAFANLGEAEPAAEAATKAYELRDRVSELEKFYSDRWPTPLAHLFSQTPSSFEFAEKKTVTFPEWASKSRSAVNMLAVADTLTGLQKVKLNCVSRRNPSRACPRPGFEIHIGNFQQPSSSPRCEVRPMYVHGPIFLPMIEWRRLLE
jgi:hypothetical protein